MKYLDNTLKFLAVSALYAVCVGNALTWGNFFSSAIIIIAIITVVNFHDVIYGIHEDQMGCKMRKTSPTLIILFMPVIFNLLSWIVWIAGFTGLAEIVFSARYYTLILIPAPALAGLLAEGFRKKLA